MKLVILFVLFNLLGISNSRANCPDDLAALEKSATYLTAMAEKIPAFNNWDVLKKIKWSSSLNGRDFDGEFTIAKVSNFLVNEEQLNIKVLSPTAPEVKPTILISFVLTEGDYGPFERSLKIAAQKKIRAKFDSYGDQFHHKIEFLEVQDFNADPEMSGVHEFLDALVDLSTKRGQEILSRKVDVEEPEPSIDPPK